MATGHGGRALVSRRRRGRRGSEDEDSVTMVEDSQSEGSILSEQEEDAEEDSSDMSDKEAAETKESKDKTNGASRKAASKPQRKKPSIRKEPIEEAQSETTATFQESSDTRAMKGGLEVTEAVKQEKPVDFDNLGDSTGIVIADGTSGTRDGNVQMKNETIADRRRREHEEYKKKRESDPTFIPNRGNFFMHDARAPDQRGFTPYGRGRGRGRGFVGGPFSPVGQAMHIDKTANAPWAHDLHHTVNESKARSPATVPVHQNQSGLGARPFQADSATKPAVSGTSLPLNFSTDKLLGKVQIRVCLPSMKSATPFPAIPFKQHTRLPDHRPPLRRDKPVRISLPDRSPRYIFPSQERSFIFIPRALRPNQQGFGRTRGSFGYGGSSRRTSVYGGSVYSPSVTMSRRSSLAHDVSREAMFSPTGSINARSMMQPGRPVVRIPQGTTYPTTSPAGSVAGHGPHSYPLPQTPAIEHYRETATMHQPRPQKTISVSGIESPATLSLHAPQQQDQQPFENQLPHHMTDSSGSTHSAHPDAAYYSYNGQMSTGTPLSNIPERAIHAQPFQPPTQGYSQGFYGQYPQPGYYYPQTYPQVQAFVGPPPSQPAQATRHTGAEPQAGTQPPSGTVAHESNGMVYYLDASQMPQQYPEQAAFQGQDNFLQPTSYAVPGMGGMMTPSPESGYYYPPVPAGGMYYPQA